MTGQSHFKNVHFNIVYTGLVLSFTAISILRDVKIQLALFLLMRIS